MTATNPPIGAPIGAKIGAPIGAKGAGDGRGAPIRRLKAAAVSAQTPVQSRALARELAQGLAREPAQWRVCDRCGKPRPPVVVAVGSDDGEADRAWCSLDHAAEDGWPWLVSEPAPPPKQRKRRCSQ